jgi:protein gp37
MSTISAIEWTEATWNPTTGCDRISAGCDNCYALTLAKRLKAMGLAKYQADGDARTSGPGFGVTVHPGALDEPLRWRKPRTVFVNSMSDLFHARVPVPFIAQVFVTMARTPRHTYQVLTKRPERMARIVGDEFDGGTALLDATTTEDDAMVLHDEWPLPNVWLGTSIELDRHTGRADALRNTAAAVRFISVEPLLDPLPSLDLAGIDWLIAGGESGPGARPVDPGWVRDLRDRCQASGVAFFFKQWGGRTPKAGGRELDGRTWDQYPDRLDLARPGHAEQTRPLIR